jgi:tetratricopeptide (TPR) repeat protein
MKLRYRACCAAVLALVFIAGCGGAQGRYESHMAKGQSFYSDGNFEKARIEFRNALQILPNDAQGRFMYGRSMERLGKVREAAGMYQGAIDIDTNHAAARAALGRVYVFAGAPEKALELVEPAIALKPEDAELLTVRAAARAQLQQPEAALADAQEAVALDAGNENAVALLASIYRQRNEAAKAIELLKGTLEKKPEATELRQVLALLYLSTGEKTDAESEMRKYVESRPTDTKPRYQLAIFLTGEKRLDDAEKVLQQAIAAAAKKDDGAEEATDEARLVYADFLAAQREPAKGVAALEKFMAESPDNYDLALGLGALRQRMNDNDAAIAVYQKIIADARKKPQGLVACNRIAAIHVAAGRIEPAKELVAQVLAENPRDNDALLLRGNLALQANDPATAIGDLRAVLRDQPDAVAVLRTLARAHAANGEGALAEESLQRAVQLAPQDAGARIELAQFLAQNGKSEQALPLIEQTVRDNPTNAQAREVLVRLYIERRDFAAAKVAADDLETLAPDRAVGYYLAGLVAQAEKRNDDARAGFEKALELQPDAADALAALMRLHLSMNRAAEAHALVGRSLARDEKNFVARNLLGELHLAARELERARAEFGKVVATAPRWTLGYRNLALTQIAGNDERAAIATLEKGIANAGQDFSLVADLAALYERGKQFDRAIGAYEALVDKRQGLTAAENNLAMLLVTYRTDQKSLDRARELTQQFASSPNAALLDTHGWVLYRRGQFAEALSVLERARKIAPDAQVVRFHLGMAQYKSGQSAQARENLQAALSSPRQFSGAEEARAALAAMGKS